MKVIFLIKDLDNYIVNFGLLNNILLSKLKIFSTILKAMKFTFATLLPGIAAFRKSV